MRMEKVDKKVCFSACNWDIFVQQNTSMCLAALCNKMNNGVTK